MCMKKFFTLALLALLSLTVQAQDKKTWDFTKDISDETIENTKADSKWNCTMNDDGTVKQINEASKMSGPFIANGTPIKELEGLSLGTAGLSKNNNVILMPGRFRINRKNMELNFPDLKNGQKLTVVGRSANADAGTGGSKAARGIAAKYGYMVRIDEDKESNIMEGANIPGSKGTYTFVYEIQTEETGAVPVAFTMSPDGGIDFTLFMIDEGDPINITKVAYLYSGSTDGDAAFTALKARENTEVTAIDVASQTITAASLQEYTLTVIAASVPADNDNVAVVKQALPWTPTLNLNGNMYAAWGYGVAVDAQPVGVVKDAKSALLKGATIQDADGVSFVELASSNIQAVNLGEYFTGDAAPLKEMNLEGAEGEGAVVHLHNEKHNGYAYLPYAADVTNDWSVIFNNAVTTLAESKAEITPAAAPVVKQEFKDKNTNVTISAGRSLPKTQFFYTTDGSNPTVESTLYTDPVNFTAPCTFKAVAIAEGYTVSEVTSLDILIHEQPKTPNIVAERADGKTTITLTCETPDVDIWYNFSEAGADTTKSTKYTEPIVITMPQNVTAFSVAGGAVFSELAQQRVLVQNPRVVIDVAGHFEARQWTADNNPDGKAVANGKGMFSWGASAATMYTGDGHTETDPETGDEKTVYGPEDMRELEVCNEPKNGENEPEWVLKSRGTCLIWQSLTPQNTNFGDDSNYNPSASTDVDELFPITKNNIQFYKFQGGEPGNASIETINKYQAPLDVVVLANMQGGPLLVQVSADGAEWKTIGEIAKTGASRMWGKFSAAYDGTDEVYVRVTQTEASGGAKVFDIYIANQGEKSKALLEDLNNELTGIETVADHTAKATKGIYNINGIRQQTLRRGLNIVVNGDGTVKKVMVK